MLGSYANYVKTSLSLSTTMQMTHLADMPGVPGPEVKSHAFIYSKIRQSTVAKQFKALTRDIRRLKRHAGNVARWPS